RLDALTGDSFDTLGELTGQAGQSLLETGDLERILAGHLIARLVPGEPDSAIEIEALAGDQLLERSRLAVAFHGVAALAFLVLALEWADIDVTKIGLRALRAGGVIVL